MPANIQSRKPPCQVFDHINSIFSTPMAYPPRLSIFTQIFSMPKKVLPYKDSDLGKKEQVREMFNNVSGNYDALNRVMTLGIDQSWRKKVVSMVMDHGAKRVMDIATGTGDLAIMFGKAQTERVVGLDLSPGMLEIGKEKVRKEGLEPKVEMVIGDSEKLQFEDGSFDAVTVAFGVRNFENLEMGLSEILRVLKPNGILVVLETSQPENPLIKKMFEFYSKFIIPGLGKLFSKDQKAYRYLPESAAAFPYGEAFNNILLKIGFNRSKVYPQTLGAATIYKAIK